LLPCHGGGALARRIVAAAPWSVHVIELVEVRRLPGHREAEGLALVLAAMGIRSWIVSEEGGTRLCVPAADRERALSELALYDRENASPVPVPGGRPFLAGLDAALTYWAILLGFFVADQTRFLGFDWLPMGAVQSGEIGAGAWWRTVTSLTLHADGEHLFGNLALGGALLLIAAQLLGQGLAALAILLAGAAGNLVNALLQPAQHTAIGASTAVFAALGILSGHLRLSRPVRWRGGIRRWAPVSAGILLLVFTGTGGERTDIGAHLAGFLAGGLAGLGLARWRELIATGRHAQRLYAALALGLLALAWLAALLSGG
jgi:membrane associated rhomboid family serine protease